MSNVSCTKLVTYFGSSVHSKLITSQNIKIIYALDWAHEKFDNGHVVQANLIQGSTQNRYAGLDYFKP